MLIWATYVFRLIKKIFKLRIIAYNLWWYPIKKRMAAPKCDVCCQLLGDQMAPQSSLGYQIWSTLSGSWPIGLLQVYELTTKKIFFSMAFIKAEYTLNIFSTKLLTSIMTSTYCGISNWIYLLWDSFPGFCAIPTPRNSLLVDKTMEMLTTICQRNSNPRFKFRNIASIFV